MKDGIIRVGAASPDLRVADPEYNRRAALDIVRRAHDGGARVLVLPELSLSAYTCGELFFQNELLSRCEAELAKFAEETADLDMLIFIGVPVLYRDMSSELRRVLRGEIFYPRASDGRDNLCGAEDGYRHGYSLQNRRLPGAFRCGGDMRGPLGCVLSLRAACRGGGKPDCESLGVGRRDRQGIKQARPCARRAAP